MELIATHHLDIHLHQSASWNITISDQSFQSSAIGTRIRWETGVPAHVITRYASQGELTAQWNRGAVNFSLCHALMQIALAAIQT